MRALALCAILAMNSEAVIASDWKPQAGPLATKWSKDVRPENVHGEYPRPQFVRREWMNLNGLWSYAILPKAAPKSAGFEGQILVPFPVESSLSGVMKPLNQQQRLWYQRSFEVPKGWKGQRVLLHFGAVDWECVVQVNGRDVGTHRGGYDPFFFDITEVLKSDGPQEVTVAVWDPTDAGYQPRGKQVRTPGSIWYTPTTGIWQTVWLEPVAQVHIDDLRITPDIDNSRVNIVVNNEPFKSKHKLRAVALDGQNQIAEATGTDQLELMIPNAKLWSPDSPTLYNLKLSLVNSSGQVVDEVLSYFGMRKIAIGPDNKGVTRILFNNKPLFQFGPLDQGFWPDGLYTAPTDEALRYDIDITKKLGFNMTRKHVKVEPQRWYYWCDKLGLLVWQDLPSGDLEAKKGKEDLEREPDSVHQYEYELDRMITTHFNSPCIVMWVPFNEGWGQFDTRRITQFVKTLDSTRLVNNASGWTDRQVGDVHDIHVYPGPGCPEPEPKRAAVLGEFGGLGLPVLNHTWQNEKNWGYKSYKSPDDLTAGYLALISQLQLLRAQPGLSAAVYTQLTDVEIEVNGLLTYDRSITKMDIERISVANRSLYAPPPAIKSILATSQTQAQPWKFSTSNPDSTWLQDGFDDSKWSSGDGGFGTKGTPGIAVGTNWQTKDIWLRKQFETRDIPSHPFLQVFHDEDCEIYVNGKKAAALSGYVTDYIYVPIWADHFKKGSNIIAVHCRQTEGGQGVDVGIVDVSESPN